MANLCSTFNALEDQADNVISLRPDKTDASSTDLSLALEKMGLLAPGDRPIVATRLGGVSSEIYRVQVSLGTVCVKRALPGPKASSAWLAPTERSGYEIAWLKLARAIVGESVPEVLGEQPGLFAMEYLDPERHRSWKAQLRDGDINSSTAAEVGRLIGRVHAATAHNSAVARRFASDQIFHAMRIESYLVAADEARPAAAMRLRALAQAMARTKLALVHGDVNPKNVLVGPKGPILLDAECAGYGDPAFDVASCLSHMLLKCVWRPQWCDRYLACFDAFAAAYRQRVTWEMPEHTDERAALLLPAIVLACVAGKSPVEYLDGAKDRSKVAAIARRMLFDPPVRLAAVRESWRRALSST
ncbi:MAG: aminoglycoside phosphotransferase family protein [Burkholderiales bacterium]